MGGRSWLSRQQTDPGAGGTTDLRLRPRDDYPAVGLRGLYLCFEGAEKLLHAGASHSEEEAARRIDQLSRSDVDLVAIEKAKIRGAIRTDFILSAEIIVLTLGVVEGSDLVTQLGVLAGIALLMTVGVYGLVAGIVKLDDIGLYLAQREGDSLFRSAQRSMGNRLVSFAPWLMKALGVVGTIAMFLVGGGILLHAAHDVEVWVTSQAGALGPVAFLATPLAGGLLGLAAGVLLAKLGDWTGLLSDHA